VCAVRRLFILICMAAPAALLTGCADLSRPEQITVVAERPAAPPPPAPTPSAAAAAAAAVRAASAGGDGAPRAGGG
jgi:hypothetical protein